MAGGILLTWDSLMCVLIIDGILRNTQYWTGITMFTEMIGSASDDVFKNNSSPWIFFLKGLICNTRGKEVPCFVSFQKKKSRMGTVIN